MKIAYIGRFQKMYDEEYIAKSFESLGHIVLRLPDNLGLMPIYKRLKENTPDILIFAKLEVEENGIGFLKAVESLGIKTVCWLFDLYWDYPRQHRIYSQPCFRAQYIFTTDGGHDEKWQSAKINHKTVRQGIYKEECFLSPLNNPHGVVFVGSENPIYPKRLKLIDFITKSFADFRWYGRKDTNEMRGVKLNELYAQSKIIVGDSVYSPYYWSNRVVETLGRGGFLIHQEVEGLKEEYPYLVTYEKGNFKDLREKIEYYLNNEEERLELIKKNFEWVKKHYTMDRKCEKLLKFL